MVSIDINSRTMALEGEEAYVTQDNEAPLIPYAVQFKPDKVEL